MKLSIIIPVYNEKGTILEILKKIEAVKLDVEKEVVIVDDFSTDGTRDMLDTLDKNKYTVVLKEKNGGKGSAVKAGISVATGDMVIFQDADLEYDPEDYPAMIQPVLDGRTEAVLGVRNSKDRTLHSVYYDVSSFGNTIITLLTNALYGNNASEYEGCYKVFTKSLLNKIVIHTDGFAYDNELVCKILKRGVETVDVPIRYYPRSYEAGKKIRMKDGFKILWTIIKYRFVD